MPPPQPPRVDSWTLFLVSLFAIVGLCGLFASYATSIPLERGALRSATLDEAAAAAAAPDAAARLEQLRPRLGDLAPAVLDDASPFPGRIAAARARILDEQQREERSLAYRTRLMLAVITLIAAVLGAGILQLARRTPG